MQSTRFNNENTLWCEVNNKIWDKHLCILSNFILKIDKLSSEEFLEASIEKSVEIIVENNVKQIREHVHVLNEVGRHEAEESLSARVAKQLKHEIEYKYTC